MSYKHLNLEERHYIQVELKKGNSQNQIATSLGRSQSCISRELKRNTIKKRYSHTKAHKQAKIRLCCSPKHTKLTKSMLIIIDKYIKKDWSPEQISGRLKIDKTLNLHHETIYQYIKKDKEKGGSLYTHLRHQKRRYKKRFNFKRNPSKIPNRRDIDERPEVVNNRERVGDWEADTIIGKDQQGAIVTLDERKSKLRLAYPLLSKKSIHTCGAITFLLGAIKAFVKRLLLIMGRSLPSMKQSRKISRVRPILLNLITLVNEGRMKMRMGYYGNTFPKKTLINIKSRESNSGSG